MTREDGVLRGVLEVDVHGSTHAVGDEDADRPIEIGGDQRTWIRVAVRVPPA